MIHSFTPSHLSRAHTPSHTLTHTQVPPQTTQHPKTVAPTDSQTHTPGSPHCRTESGPTPKTQRRCPGGLPPRRLSNSLCKENKFIRPHTGDIQRKSFCKKRRLQVSWLVCGLVRWVVSKRLVDIHWPLRYPLWPLNSSLKSGVCPHVCW